MLTKQNRISIKAKAKEKERKNKINAKTFFLIRIIQQQE